MAREHGNTEADMILKKKLRILHLDPQATERELLGLVWAFETSKSIPSDILPPMRPHLLILLKYWYSLMTKHWNIWADGGHSYSNPSSHIPSWQAFYLLFANTVSHVIETKPWLSFCLWLIFLSMFTWLKHVSAVIMISYIFLFVLFCFWKQGFSM